MPGILFYIIKHRPETILAVNNSTQLTEYLALPLCKVLKIRFVWWTHAYDHGRMNLPKLFKENKRKYVLFFLNHSDSVITFSNKGRDYLISMGIYSDKIFTAPNTLDTTRLIAQRKYLENKLTKSEIFKELNLNLNDKIILYSGQLKQR